MVEGTVGGGRHGRWWDGSTKGPVLGYTQGVKRYLSGEVSGRIIKKRFNTMDLGDFPESNSTWHSISWVQDAPEANTKSG